MRDDKPTPMEFLLFWSLMAIGLCLFWYGVYRLALEVLT